MSNLDKARAVASEWIDLMGGLDNISYLYGNDIGILVQAIHAAGLLMPDLPEPELRHLEDVNTNILAWKSDHIEVGFYKNRIAMDDPPKGSMSPVEARELAHALLAAADYAEKEKENE